MKRQRSQSTIKRDQNTLRLIQTIKLDHPLWGYRRVWCYLRYRMKIIIGKNRVHRVMKEQKMLVTKNQRLKAKRGHSNRPKPQATRPNQFWGIDMTKIKLATWGWLYLHIVLDWYTKEIVGYSLSIQSKTDDWLDALGMAVNSRFPNGINDKEHKPKLISDNGSQPTSQKFMMNTSLLGINQIFTSWCNPKGNADTERVMRTIKEDLIWINDWDDPMSLTKNLHTWIHDYNTDYPHQALKYMTPSQFNEQFNQELVLT